MNRPRPAKDNGPTFTGPRKANNIRSIADCPPARPAKECVILDVNELAKGEKFMSVAQLAVSDDANLLAYSKDNTGLPPVPVGDQRSRTGRLLPDQAERVTSVAWAADNQTLFYTTEEPVNQTEQTNSIVCGWVKSRNWSMKSAMSGSTCG